MLTALSKLMGNDWMVADMNIFSYRSLSMRGDHPLICVNSELEHGVVRLYMYTCGRCLISIPPHPQLRCVGAILLMYALNVDLHGLGGCTDVLLANDLRVHNLMDNADLPVMKPGHCCCIGMCI